MFLEQIGADPSVWRAFEASAIAGQELGRVSFASHEQYRIFFEAGECDAVPAGRLRLESELPAVGDWVTARPVDSALALIETVLPRRTQFSRRAPGKAAAEQVIASNINLAFIVCGLDGDFNPRRIERYLVLAHESGAEPVIVLNKADIARSVAEAVETVEQIASGARVIVMSALQSVEALAGLARDQTVALLGSSGAGKSTIVNGLLGEQKQATGGVRLDDSRGRHTTTSRMLLPLPEGGAIIDNPGLRELQLWAEPAALDEAFEEIRGFAERCRFRDCGHRDEPGCAVREALEIGHVNIERWQSYRKLEAELRHNLLEQDARARAEQKKRWKSIHKALRKHPKYRNE